MKFITVKTLAHIFSFLWLLSIIVFGGIIFYGTFITDTVTQQQSTVLVFVVLTGLFAFLGALVLYLIHLLFLRKRLVVGTPRSPRMDISPLFLILILFLISIGGVVAVAGAYNLGQASKLRDEQKTVTAETNPSPTVQVKYVESDPVITCTSSYPNCSGQSIQVRQSACSTITCCQVGDKWSVYPSENDCKAAQAAVAPTSKPQPQNNAATKYPPCTINYSDLGAITYYTIPPEECASKQTNQKVHEAQRDSYDQCVRNYGADNCQKP
jgi:hypothetical protein